MKPCIRIGHTLFPAIAGLILAGARTQAGLLSSSEFNGHTYQIWGNDGIVNDERNFADARLFAASLNAGGAAGTLVRIDDGAEHGFVFGQLFSVEAQLTTTAADGGGGRYAWMGASDLDGEGIWKWDAGGDQFWAGNKTGLAVGGAFEFWSQGTLGVGDPPRTEPDNSNGNQNAAAIAIDRYPVILPPEFYFGLPGMWNDLNTADVLPFIVEFAPVPEPETWAVITGGLLVVFAWGRRHRKRSAG